MDWDGDLSNPWKDMRTAPKDREIEVMAPARVVLELPVGLLVE